MSTMQRFIRFAPFALAFAPLFAQAQVGTVSRVAGIFNIFVGLMLTVALLLYALGFVMWVIRLGTWPSYRTEAVRVLEWSVAVLFVLIVILMIVQFFQRNPTAATYVLSAIVVVAVLGFIIYIMLGSGGEHEHKEEVKH